MKPADIAHLRRAFGQFMTGVTVVTARDANGNPVGFTANSFTSVSLDPPLLLVCPGKSMSSFDVFANCESFAVSILAEDQVDVATVFASRKGDRFALVPCEDDDAGSPLVAGAAAHFSCHTHQVVDAGDHILLVGRVVNTRHTEAPCLGYHRGQFVQAQDMQERFLDRKTKASRDLEEA